MTRKLATAAGYATTARWQRRLAAPGRTVTLAEDEKLQHRLRKLVATPVGRQKLRQRVGIEQRLAHISQRQGRRARYCGARNHLFDLRRCCAIQKLETSHLREAEKAA